MKNNITLALVSSAPISENMAGPAIRYFELAKVLSNHFAVTLFAPNNSSVSIDNVEIKSYDNRVSNIGNELINFDYVLAQALPPTVLFKLNISKAKYIADLYDPIIIEAKEHLKSVPKRLADPTYKFQTTDFGLQMIAASHILASSEIQKNLYVVHMLATGIVTSKRFFAENKLNDLISLLPFGISDIKPEPTEVNYIEKKFPNIKSTDKVILWGGGIWDWFDPMSVIKAIEQIATERDDIKLVFIGFKNPDPKVRLGNISEEVYEYCVEHNLIDNSIFFNTEWTPYQERANYLLRSTACISTHFDSLETKYAYRTRILDYFWAQKPTICTKGDVLADLVGNENLGIVVDYSDVSAIKNAIIECCDDTEKTKEIVNNIKSLYETFKWKNICKELVALIKEDKIVKNNFCTIIFHKNVFLYYYFGIYKKLMKFFV